VPPSGNPHLDRHREGSCPRVVAPPRNDLKSPGENRGFSLLVRPAWALSRGCKSRRKEVILIEANRNCERATNAAFPISYFDQLGVPRLAS